MEDDATSTPRLGRRDPLVPGRAGALGLAGARRLPPPNPTLFSFAVACGFHHGLRRARDLLSPGMPRGQDGDRLVPIAPAPPPLKAGEAYPAEQALEALAESAKAVLAGDDTRN
jgi:hypothetical protein